MILVLSLFLYNDVSLSVLLQLTLTHPVTLSNVWKRLHIWKTSIIPMSSSSLVSAHFSFSAWSLGYNLFALTYEGNMVVISLPQVWVCTGEPSSGYLFLWWSCPSWNMEISTHIFSCHASEMNLSYVYYLSCPQTHSYCRCRCLKLSLVIVDSVSANSYPVHAGYCSRDGVSKQQKHHPSGFGCSQLHVSYFMRM